MQESNICPEFGEVSSICTILNVCGDKNSFSILWCLWHNGIQ